MTLPPERISIKRRRQEEPVETLFLESELGRDKKRKFTDFFFQRLHNESAVPPSKRLAKSPPKAPSKPVPDSKEDVIPHVRATKPGDEVKEQAQYRDRQKARQDSQQREGLSQFENVLQKPTTKQTDDESRAAPGGSTLPRNYIHARRFHLSRDLSSVFKSSSENRVTKHKSLIRPPLATFVEKHVALIEQINHSIHEQQPVDKILNISGKSESEDLATRSSETPISKVIETSTRLSTGTFLKTRSPAVKRGQSIKDHPSTWDIESDQLANELAALAMELDPPPPPPASDEPLISSIQKDNNLDISMQDDEFVYETYIRVRHYNIDQPSNEQSLTERSFGVLVIEQEDEELWERYAESDEETDWDEEDSNAEDNPANDYPEDEVSSDDEYDYNPYKYQRPEFDTEDYEDSDYDD